LDTSNTSWIGFKTLTLACSVCTLNHVTCIPNSHIQGSEGHLIHLRAAEYGIHWLRCVLSTGLLEVGFGLPLSGSVGHIHQHQGSDHNTSCR
jgi:hypothetical protein